MIFMGYVELLIMLAALDDDAETTVPGGVV